MLIFIRIFILACIFIMLVIGLLLLIYNHYQKENYFNYVGKKIVKNKLNHPRWTQFVDKSKFKHLCKKLGIKTLNSLYELDKLSEIDNIYDKLPNSFIVKSNKSEYRLYMTGVFLFSNKTINTINSTVNNIQHRC